MKDANEYIKHLVAMGRGVIKENEIMLDGEVNNECIYITFNLSIALTPETRIYISDESAIINKCEIFSPMSETKGPVELVKLVGNGYAVYGGYYIAKNQQLRLFFDTKPDRNKIEMKNFYYVGPEVE